MLTSHKAALNLVQTDIRKLAGLGYAPQVPLAAGLPPTVDWYFANESLAPKA